MVHMGMPSTGAIIMEKGKNRAVAIFAGESKDHDLFDSAKFFQDG